MPAGDKSGTSGASTSPDVYQFQGSPANNKDEPDSLPLRFLNFSHPAQARTRTTRKTVRSHVTTVQHQKDWERRQGKVGSPGSWRAESPDSSSPEGDTVVTPAVTRPRKTARLGGKASSFLIESPASQTSISVRTKRGDDGDGSAAPALQKQVAMSRVDPFLINDPSLDWTVDVPLLIHQHLTRARSFMISHGMPEVARVLRPQLIQPRLYLDRFLFNALTAIAATNVLVADEQKPHEALVTWLRSNWLIAIRNLVATGSYDPRVLAIGIALLVGWELDVGDPSTCAVHLSALPNVIKSKSQPRRPSNDESAYQDEVNGQQPNHARKRLPPGFEYYRSQNLLPPSLMVYVGSLALWDSSAPGASYWLREIWGAIAACAPLESNAQKSVAQGVLASKIAQLVRQAGIMLGSFMRSSAGVVPVAQPLVSGLRANWYRVSADIWDSLIGTVFDEILLWCICVFCAVSGFHNDGQLKAISCLLGRLDIHAHESFLALLRTFVWPDSLEQDLLELCSQMRYLLPSAWNNVVR